jgi:hypothetical protein
MDLSGLSPSNQGCTYELGQLIDRVPTSRFILLVDATTDLGFPEGTLKAACARMAFGSPNHSTDYGPVKLFQLRQEYGKGSVSLEAVQ